MSEQRPGHSCVEEREQERCGSCGQFGAHCSRPGGSLVSCDICWGLVCGGCLIVDPEEGELVCGYHFPDYVQPVSDDL